MAGHNCTMFDTKKVPKTGVLRLFGGWDFTEVRRRPSAFGMIEPIFQLELPYTLGRLVLQFQLACCPTLLVAPLDVRARRGPTRGCMRLCVARVGGGAIR